MKDRIFELKQNNISDFAFDESVVKVFPDMIRRSIPGYETMISMTGLLIASKLKNPGLVYDLGCSLGASTKAILDHHPEDEINVIAVDNSKDMIERAKENIKDHRVQFVLGDVLETRIDSADAVVGNFIMQFLPQETREPFLKKIYKGMNSDSILIISEKIDDSSYIAIHEDWKKANGYSNIEVEQKRQSLENVMRVDSESTHLKRFESAGFTAVQQWFRCLNWASFLMYK